jgi:hypothetical protein
VPSVGTKSIFVMQVRSANARGGEQCCSDSTPTDA